VGCVGLSWEVGSDGAAMDDTATCHKRHACASHTCHMSHTHVAHTRVTCHTLMWLTHVSHVTHACHRRSPLSRRSRRQGLGRQQVQPLTLQPLSPNIHDSRPHQQHHIIRRRHCSRCSRSQQPMRRVLRNAWAQGKPQQVTRDWLPHCKTATLTPQQQPQRLLRRV